MAADRFVLLGLASVRAPWFRIVTGWAMSGSLPIEFIKCVSAEELRARLRTGRQHSAVLLDGDLPAVDRDLLALADEHTAPAIVVAAPHNGRDYLGLGAVATLPPDFSRDELLETLRDHCRPVVRVDTIELAPTESQHAPTESVLVATIGRAGSGTSTTAIAAAQAMSDDPALGGFVVLADLARRADLAMLHDAHDVVPGIQELVDAHRSGSPSGELVRSLTFDIPERGYDLLLGLRRPNDWVALRPRSFAAALAGLRRAYRAVVVDLDDDLEGELDAGSIDVEERNVAQRQCVTDADVVLAVGTPTLVGVHALMRLVDDLIRFEVDPTRIQPVVAKAPKSNRARAELTRTIAELGTTDTPELATPIFLPTRRRLDDIHRNGARMPSTLADPLAGAIAAALTRPDRARVAADDEPQLVTPGSLGSWAEEGS